MAFTFIVVLSLGTTILYVVVFLLKFGLNPSISKCNSFKLAFVLTLVVVPPVFVLPPLVTP